MINVDTHEAKSQLSAPLGAVEDQAPNPLQMHPELAGTILYDPTEPATEDEWPAEFR
jgi:hypothetical protein